MDSIQISDLEVFYSVGVTDEERSKPQRLLLTIEMFRDIAPAATTDDIGQTIDYYTVCQRLLQFGKGRSWKLIETLASEIASMILHDFAAESVNVEVRKFIIPQAQFVSVRLSRHRTHQR